MRERPALDEKGRAFEPHLASWTALLDDAHFHVADAERSRPLQRLEQRGDPLRAGHDERPFAALQPQRAEQPGQAVEVIAVQVSDQHRIEPRERESGAQRRKLCSLAAVAQDPAALAGGGERRGSAHQRGAARRGAERNDAELHARSSTMA